MNLVNKTREEGQAKNRSVSFSAVSVMVESIMKRYHSVSRNKISELSVAIESSSVHLIR